MFDVFRAEGRLTPGFLALSNLLREPETSFSVHSPVTGVIYCGSTCLTRVVSVSLKPK